MSPLLLVQLGLGAGADILSGAADDLIFVTGAGVYGGGGSDTITINAINAASGAFVNVTAQWWSKRQHHRFGWVLQTIICVKVVLTPSLLLSSVLQPSLVMPAVQITLTDYNSGAVVNGGQGGDLVSLTGTTHNNSCHC